MAAKQTLRRYTGLIAALLLTLVCGAALDNRICMNKGSYTSDLDYVVFARNSHNQYMDSRKFDGRIISPVHVAGWNGRFVDAYRLSSKNDREAEMVVFLGDNTWSWGLAPSKEITVSNGDDIYISHISACGVLQTTTR